MELSPIVSVQTSWICLGVIVAGFASWALFLWRRGRRLRKMEKED